MEKNKEISTCDCNILMNIIESLPNATLAINLNHEIIVWNKKMEKMTGVLKSEIIGQGQFAYSVPFYGKVRTLLVDLVLNNSYQINSNNDIDIRRKGDTLFCEEFAPAMLNGKGAFILAKAAPLYNAKGEIIGAIESIHDISQQKVVEEQLKYISYHDSLTGLYNRTFYEAEISRLQKKGQPVGLMICDVDGLKNVNDLEGHQAGDQLLIRAAWLLKNSITENETLARIGGDEFAVIFSDADLTKIKKVKHTIQTAIEENNREHPENIVNISIGYDIGEKNKNDYKLIFTNADNYMYHNKISRNQKNLDSIIKSLVEVLKVKDFAIDGKMERLQLYIRKVSQHFNLSERKIHALTLLAKFHDIGQIGITDHILMKHGSLTEEEVNIMKQHVEIGFGIAQLAQEFARIADWILKHHERWDGKGYPLGLKGEKIPLECRILAVIDAYEAMTSTRPYRKAKTHQEAVCELERCSGFQFDPSIVKIFIESFKE